MEKCSVCGTIPVHIYCVPGGFACHACKVKQASEAFLAAPFTEKWDECAIDGMPYAMRSLARLYLHLTRNKGTVLADVVGKDVAKTHSHEWRKLLEFAKDEWDNYEFYPIDF